MIKKMVTNLLYKDLSYQIHGAAIEVRKDFGPGHKEKLYQKSFAEELKRRGIKFEREKSIKIYSPKDGQLVGLYRPDFIIDEKIIVELKAEKFVRQEEIKRIYDYLRNSKYELAYFINFASPRLFVRRIIYSNNRKPFGKNLLASICFILAFFSGIPAWGATLFLDLPTEKIYRGDAFEVAIRLDSSETAINAARAEVVFQPEMLEVVSLGKANSILVYWPEEPVFNNTGGRVTFIGGLPTPGFKDTDGLVGAITFIAQKTGEANLGFANDQSQVLVNDGRGSKAVLDVRSISLVINEPPPGYQLKKISPIIDIIPPDKFVPRISRSKNIFDNKYFVAFHTQDRESGLSYYEVMEIKDNQAGSWIKARSPHLLENQSGYVQVLVKAVDNAGNETIGEVTINIVNEKLIITFLAIVILCLVIAGVILYKLVRLILRRDQDGLE